jgi:hypothetical protein
MGVARAHMCMRGKLFRHVFAPLLTTATHRGRVYIRQRAAHIRVCVAAAVL